ncbi:hypothetical protein CFP71_01370 [Amycolatopsis thailandensis]|uniref:Uncharacterized protein n=1 Tax=Amycolatopsis thailandensis TaxID=589330 RepID=A0A229SIK6_9PSEU|nr:hypothetical protein [Amycolatopsis thailandensis]OXM58692.1 hypothetical protein CFP71_01370 [Amycolatopsis thailandensis]
MADLSAPNALDDLLSRYGKCRAALQAFPPSSRASIRIAVMTELEPVLEELWRAVQDQEAA